ncbi:RICIN domain-containing protein, partial [Streptomyces caniscabiei]
MRSGHAPDTPSRSLTLLSSGPPRCRPRPDTRGAAPLADQALGFQGSTITARIDGTTVGTVTDNSFSGGLAGLGAAGYYPVQHSNLSITPGTVPDLSGTYKIVSVRSGKALDASGGGTANGTPIIQWTDTGSTNQQWRLARNSAGYYSITGVASNKALDIPFATTSPNTRFQLWTPTGQ